MSRFRCAALFRSPGHQSRASFADLSESEVFPPGEKSRPDTCRPRPRLHFIYSGQTLQIDTFCVIAIILAWAVVRQKK